MNKTLINILAYIVEIASMLAFICVIAAIPASVFLSWYMWHSLNIAIHISVLYALIVCIGTTGFACAVGMCCGVWSKALEDEKERI